MITYALGTLADWLLLSPTEQAYYSGGHYTDLITIVAAHGDPLTDDVTIELIGDVEFTTTQYLWQDCLAKKWVFTSRSGNRFVVSVNVANNGVQINCQFNKNQNFEINNIIFKSINTAYTAETYTLLWVGGGVLTADFSAVIENCFFNCGTHLYSHGYGVRLAGASFSGAYIATVKNCIFWNHKGVGLICIGYGGTPEEGVLAINNSFHNELDPYTTIGLSNTDGSTKAPLRAYNNVSFGAGDVDYEFVTPTSPGADPGIVDGSNNADSDNSLTIGTNNVHNIVAVDEFQTLDDTDLDIFLKLIIGTIDASFTREPLGNLLVNQKCKFTPSVVLTPGSLALGQTGREIATVTDDISGEARPGIDEFYSIGAHEQQFS